MCLGILVCGVYLDVLVFVGWSFLLEFWCFLGFLADLATLATSFVAKKFECWVFLVGFRASVADQIDLVSLWHFVVCRL